jgi:hypothetical protein
MHDELARAGVRVSDVQKNGPGTIIYCKHDGFLVEVSCRPRCDTRITPLARLRLQRPGM